MASLYDSKKPARKIEPHDPRFKSRLHEMIAMCGYTKRVQESGRGLNPFDATDISDFLVEAE